MRYLALLFSILVLAGCESTNDAYVSGRIARETAVAIAQRACPQFPYPLSKVTRASWRPEHGYWAIDLKDEDEEWGKFYLVDAKGRIVGMGRIHGNQYF